MDPYASLPRYTNNTPSFPHYPSHPDPSLSHTAHSLSLHPQQQQQQQQPHDLSLSAYRSASSASPPPHPPSSSSSSNANTVPVAAYRALQTSSHEHHDIDLAASLGHQSAIQAFAQDAGRAGGLSRPFTLQEQERLEHLDRLKFFLTTAPSHWSSSTPGPIAPSSSSSSSASAALLPDPAADADPSAPHHAASHPNLKRFLLPNQEHVSCVLWNGLYHITGTDIVRALVFRFEAFGRPVKNMKKFEEGVFSDLRNLKPGVDACLEEPKVSPGILCIILRVRPVARVLFFRARCDRPRVLHSSCRVLPCVRS